MIAVAATTPKLGAQARWAATPVRARLEIVAGFRRLLAERAQQFAAASGRDQPNCLVAEVLPMLDACRFLLETAENALAPRRMDNENRPIWLVKTRLEVRREPVGTVLVIGPGNYPFFLAGIQTVQALVAGNAVVLKPGIGAGTVLRLMAETLVEAGLDPALLDVTSEDVDEVYRALDTGQIGLIVMTGSENAGRKVQIRAAELGIRTVMELSGEDPVFVLPSADLDRVVKALRFGTTFNNGETCIAPKLVIAWSSVAAEVTRRMEKSGIDLVVIPVNSSDEALFHASRSGFALGATIFGREKDALEFAGRVDAGVVVINDMIAPTADPRLPFGGRRRSGYGVTRGIDGLLEMTQIKSIVVRKGRWVPHLDKPADANIFLKYIRLVHGSWWRRGK